jgi:hypothetical protein
LKGYHIGDKMGERESKVKDLEEKLKRGELTPKEVKKS